MSRYLFKTARLGFRKWREDDLPAMAAINADIDVMRYFPGVQGEPATASFIQRMQEQFALRGYTYFAVDLLETTNFTGFIGLSYQDFRSPWTPFTDIGWRLGKKYWGMGLATEGAKKVIEFGFSNTDLDSIFSVAPSVNQPSINVMQKIGMQKVGEFAHPKLVDFPELENCVVYKISP